MPGMHQSALVVVVPEAEALVGGLRSRFDPSALVGVPAHISLLFPFAPRERLTADVLNRLRGAIGQFVRFEFTLARIDRFPETTYLVPEPGGPFAEMSAALALEFPDYPPYGGRFSEVIPHLTVADQNAEFAAVAAFELVEMLKRSGGVRSTCDTVTLLENSIGGCWRTYDSFPLKRSRLNTV
jgi:2'-5' RNA ligase